MTDSSDVQAMESISNAVDESQKEIILSTQYIKAQEHLAEKLRKQCKQQREACDFINSSNMNLKTEIRIADQNIKRMTSALETIKSANVDLHKELLLAPERKSDIVKRVTTGIKKYEDLWQEAKAKYESIPFIKHYHQIKNESHAIEQNINALINDSEKLTKDIYEKKKMLAESDKSRILELANYLTNERPKTLTLVMQKRDKVAELDNEIRTLIKRQNVDVDVPNVNFLKKTGTNIDQKTTEEDNELEMNKSGDDSVMELPKLELRYVDLDGLANRLDKIKKADSFSVATKETKPVHRPNTEISNPHEDYKMVLIDDNMNDKAKNYSQKKLIHILDNIKISEIDTQNILANANLGDIRPVQISEVILPRALNKQKARNDTNEQKMEDAEAVDLTPGKSFVVGPPAEYLDLTECSQKNNITPTEENPGQSSLIISNKTNEDNAGEALDLAFEYSGASDTAYQKIKDTIFKKHKLDLSPQFVYSKKRMSNADKKSEEVTSKFFDDKYNEVRNEGVIIKSPNYSNVCNKTSLQINDTVEEVQNKTAESSKIKENSFEHKNDMPISGFLFNHGPDGLIQLSNISMNTTSYDGENDFPHDIDASLLLSPKADLEIQETNTNNVKVLSQEVPSFLSGLRKTGFSFFGSVANDDVAASDAGTSTQQNSNFNFNFGGEEKKTRGGLFSMFR